MYICRKLETVEDDTVLIARIVEDDHKSFDTLVRRYYSTLFAVAQRMIQDSAEAEDIVQDIFVNLWNSRHKYLDVCSPKDYLFISLRNLAMRRLHEKNKLHALTEDHKVAFYDYWEYILEEETYRLLIEAIDALPPRSREVIKHSLTGMRQEEIAQEMGITIATVKALKADGIKKLRKALGPIVLLLFGLG